MQHYSIAIFRLFFKIYWDFFQNLLPADIMLLVSGLRRSLVQLFGRLPYRIAFCSPGFFRWSFATRSPHSVCSFINKIKPKGLKLKLMWRNCNLLSLIQNLLEKRFFWNETNVVTPCVCIREYLHLVTYACYKKHLVQLLRKFNPIELRRYFSFFQVE